MFLGAAYDVLGAAFDVLGTAFDVFGLRLCFMGAAFDVLGAAFDVLRSRLRSFGSVCVEEGSKITVQIKLCPNYTVSKLQSSPNYSLFSIQILIK